MKLLEGFLTVKDLRDIGVANISIGPQLQSVAAEAFANAAKKVLGGS